MHPLLPVEEGGVPRRSPARGGQRPHPARWVLQRVWAPCCCGESTLRGRHAPPRALGQEDRPQREHRPRGRWCNISGASSWRSRRHTGPRTPAACGRHSEVHIRLSDTSPNSPRGLPTRATTPCPFHTTSVLTVTVSEPSRHQKVAVSLLLEPLSSLDSQPFGYSCALVINPPETHRRGPSHHVRCLSTSRWLRAASCVRPRVSSPSGECPQGRGGPGRLAEQS